MKHTKKYSGVLFLLVIFSLNAQKKNDSLFTPHYYLYAGGFIPDVSTSIRFDSKTVHVGTVLSLEENLNFDDQPKLIRADGIAKLSKRSTLALTFLAINRSRTFTLDRDIQFMDTTFKLGASAKMYFNTNYWALSYRYNIFAKPTWSAGLSFGMRVLTLRTGITAESIRFGSYSSSSELAVPAALIGIHGSAYLTKRFQFRYTWEYLKLGVNGINIYVFDNNLALEYYILKNLGIGGSYSNFNFHVKEIPFNSEFEGQIQYTFPGFSLFLAARF